MTRALTEFREKQIAQLTKEGANKINEWGDLEHQERLRLGSHYNEIKAGYEKDGRSGEWPEFILEQVKLFKRYNKKDLITWMRAAEAFDNPEIDKTGLETI